MSGLTVGEQSRTQALIQELRWYTAATISGAISHEAADCIERLERENLELRHKVAELLLVQAERDDLRGDKDEYCEVLGVLGMEEEGSAVTEILRLIEFERACRASAEADGLVLVPVEPIERILNSLQGKPNIPVSPARIIELVRKLNTALAAARAAPWGRAMTTLKVDDSPIPNAAPLPDFHTLTIDDVIRIRSAGDSFACTANNARFRKIVGVGAYCSCCKLPFDEIADFLPSYQICRSCWGKSMPAPAQG